MPRTNRDSFIQECFDIGVVLMAGIEAEKRLIGDASLGRFDLAEARAYADALALSSESAPLYLNLFITEAAALIGKYWHAITAVAERLLVRETLTGTEIDEIIGVAEAERNAKAYRKHQAAIAAGAKKFEAQNV